MVTPVVIGPTQAIDAPRIQPPATGLVSLARQPEMSDDRWQLGYSYRPEVPAGTVRNRSTGGTTTIGSSYGGTNADNNRVTVIPVYLTVEDVTSAFSYEVLDLPSRVERALDAYTSKLLAHEFWTGEIAVTDSLPNPVLASAATVNITSAYGGPLAPQAAVAALMQSLADNGMSDGMIHCSKYVGLRMPDAWRNSQTLEDHGFLVVADSGYPGTGPASQAGPNWAYATEIVNVRLGPVEIVPMDLPQSIDRGSNTLTYRAQRVGAVDFAGPVFAVQVTP